MPKQKSGTVYINKPTKKTRSNTKEDIKKLDKLVSESSYKILEIKSVFPFQIFPDKLIIELNKVNIIHLGLFFKNEFPILIDDIKTVKVTRGFVFSSILFEVRGYAKNPYPITYIWPNEADKAKNYIMALLDARNENIDLSNINRNILIKRLEEIGKSREDV
jgi:hypothetical protein